VPKFEKAGEDTEEINCVTKLTEDWLILQKWGDLSDCEQSPKNSTCSYMNVQTYIQDPTMTVPLVRCSALQVKTQVRYASIALSHARTILGLSDHELVFNQPKTFSPKAIILPSAVSPK
jgi:hypothetical protein